MGEFVTRFAPSPTGYLHLGHACSAFHVWEAAKAANGRVLLRIEDIDQTRCRPEYEAAILEDLAWLGLVHDGPVLHQSARLDAYAAAGEQLKAMGLLYPCQCTRAEVLAASSSSGPDGPVYAGTCRDRDVNPQGAAWRIAMDRAVRLAGPLSWDDELAGRQEAMPQRFGDIVLLRKEAPASYHLAATLDDAWQGVTLVTRGHDLFQATHVHRLLQALLDLPVPRWHHHALLIEADGRKLAKRRGSPALKDLRDAGVDGAVLSADLRAGRFPAGLSLGLGLGDGT